jgi:hypothetical protein
VRASSHGTDERRSPKLTAGRLDAMPSEKCACAYWLSRYQAATRGEAELGRVRRYAVSRGRIGCQTPVECQGPWPSRDQGRACPTLAAAAACMFYHDCLLAVPTSGVVSRHTPGLLVLCGVLQRRARRGCGQRRKKKAGERQTIHPTAGPTEPARPLATDYCTTVRWSPDHQCRGLVGAL